MAGELEKKGFVYIMTNPDMPGLLKVGMTKRIPTERIKDDDLSSTGIPSPFIVQYFALFDDMRKAEGLAHRKLSQFRHAKEFFKVDIKIAIQAIESTGVPFQARHSQPEIDRRIAEQKAEQDKRLGERKVEQYRKQIAEVLRQEQEERARQEWEQAVEIEVAKENKEKRFAAELRLKKINKWIYSCIVALFCSFIMVGVLANSPLALFFSSVIIISLIILIILLAIKGSIRSKL